MQITMQRVSTAKTSESMDVSALDENPDWLLTLKQNFK